MVVIMIVIVFVTIVVIVILIVVVVVVVGAGNKNREGQQVYLKVHPAGFRVFTHVTKCNFSRFTCTPQHQHTTLVHDFLDNVHLLLNFHHEFSYFC